MPEVHFLQNCNNQIDFNSPFFNQFRKNDISVVFNRRPSLYLEIKNIAHIVIKPLHYEFRHLVNHSDIIFQMLDKVIRIINITKFAVPTKKIKY
jgi:hypothetical protein